MKVGSLFSGIGGFDLGLERAGMEVVWQVEIDPFCRRVLAKHWPDVRRYEDVRDVGAHNLEAVDVIAGGFPCQDISYAGKGAGLAGERSGLWWEFARIIREMGPRYVVVENVTALLARGMGDVLGTLADFGYDSEWESVRADWFGVSQSRPRTFIVAYPASLGSREVLHYDPVDAPGYSSRLHGQGPSEAHTHHEDHRTRPVPVLGNGQGASVPNGERIGEDDGAPCRLDRLRSLGNAVVPDVAEWIGSRIMESLP